MKPLRAWRLERPFETGVDLLVDGRHLLSLFVLDHDLIRILLRKDGSFRLGRTWSIAPERDVPWEGRSRLDLTGFPCPAFELEEGADGLVLTTTSLRLTVERPLHMVWEARSADGSWRRFAEDRQSNAYMLGVRDHAHWHFLKHVDGECIYGLGEKAGDLERTGRRFEMRNLDAMGYNARTTDPLYKHIPFTITRTPEAGAYSLFYDNLANCWFDLGNEIDFYHLLTRSYRAEDGDLDLYMRWAPTIADLVRAQAALTGGTAFPPFWSLGYSGSTMHYTDAENAQDQVEGFLKLVGDHAIPCDSFQLSSGYTSIAGKRYVFNWNTDKFPDPRAMAGRFAASGVHLAANIKPCLLQDHPRYREAAESGLFIRDSETGAPERSPFWGDEGSHLDFTNPQTVRWWKDGVTGNLLNNGIESTWNDNNEFEVWDRGARCAGFGDPVEVALVRPLMAQLMVRSSHEAQTEHAPAKRPYLITRSGCYGVQRYAQTWSGDNRTSWETLRYNIRMGLGMSLSGLFNVGHDVGGFAGPEPGPELFVRWVQNGIFHPRFTIHSWSDDGTVNEPWMYPEATDLIREAIRLRYRLLPYLYTALYRAVADNEPMLRPVFLDHEHDPRCFRETDDFMIGQDLLVANVVEQGAVERDVYLPDNGVGWWDFWNGSWLDGGQAVTIPVDLASMPLFVRAGAILPLAGALDRADPALDRERTFAAFPGSGGEATTGMAYGDDGDSVEALSGRHCLTRFSLVGDDQTVRLDWQVSGTWRPAYQSVRISLPAQETRRLVVNGNSLDQDGTVPFP